jgi:hypothetical protein
MKTIKELLDEVIDLEGKVQISQAIDFHKGVPTLEKGVYRNVSPMLKIRYGAFGKWLMRHMEIGLIQKKWKVHGMKMKRMNG